MGKFAKTLGAAVFGCAGTLLAAAEGASPVDPLVTRWTFGAHEPMAMYRRMGRRSTGAIDGNAQWTKDWLAWFDAHAPEKMQELGFNFIHSRFYKGMGWEVEQKDFPNVRRFVANCHAHGVRTLAYVQFGTLYPEMMRHEIPAIDSWCGRDRDGRPNLWGGAYFRWMPCLTCREWEDYLKRMCTVALTEGGFDGIMFDNVFDAPCHCPRCTKAFHEWLRKIPDPEERFGLARTDDLLLPQADYRELRRPEVRDPVLQAWLVWRCEVMAGVMSRLRAHVKSVRPDAVVSGNPSPYRSRAEHLYKAQDMVALSKAFDVIVMQNDNFPEVKDGRIFTRARDLKFAQDLGQRLVALCDNIENLYSDREKKFVLPMIEDVVFGGIPTDRTTLFPSREPGFVNAAAWAHRKPIHARFNAFVRAHRAELEAPTVHSVRIFYPSRSVLLSEATHQGIAAAEEIFLRNRVPYGYLVSTPDDPMTVPAGTEVVVVPGLTMLSDAQVEALAAYAEKGGKLVVTGDSGRYDGWNAERRTNPLLVRVKKLPNVVCRDTADRLPQALLAWGNKVDAPTDGGRALTDDLRRVGWRSPLEFENLPPHVFAEYRRLASGELAVHLVNYMPERPVSGARIRTNGRKATFEAPFGADSSVRAVPATGDLPTFAEYALVKLSDVSPASSVATVDPIEARLSAADEANDAAWRAVADGAALTAKVADFKARFRRAIGHDGIEWTPLAAQVAERKDFDGFRLEKVLLQSAPGAYVTALVFLPDAAKFAPPYAGFVFIPGHADSGKANPSYLAICELAARHGLAALVYDPLGQGERAQGAGIRNADEHVRIGAYAALLGETTATYMLRDAERVLDYLESRPDIDRTRLGVAGNSGGATMAAYLAVADDRIRAAAPSCYISSAREHLTACGPQDAEQQFLGGIGWGFNHAALVLSAECPVLVNAATDDFFQVEGARSTYRLVREVAAKAGLADDRYGLTEAPGPHALSQTHREASVRFFLKHLKGEVRDVVETKRTTFGKADVTVTADGEVSHLPGFKSIYETLAERFVREGVSVERAAERAKGLVLRERAGAECRDVLKTLTGETAKGRRAVLRLGGEMAADEVTATLFADGPRYVRKSVRKGKFSYYENRGDDEVVAVELYGEGRSLLALRAAEALVLAAELERRTGCKPDLVAEGRWTAVAAFAAAADPAAFAHVRLERKPKTYLESLRARDYLSFADM